MKIFYSWQSDLPNATNRGFIRGALTDAVKQVAAELDIQDADRPEVDEATKGAKGMVDITASILKKISECAVYVADVTPIAHNKKRKALPNPNVMYELGWASHRPGYDFIIGVMNTYKNNGPNSLPFDLRGRRVLTYELADAAPADVKAKVKKNLTVALRGALKENIADLVQKPKPTEPIKLSLPDRKDFSLWAGNNRQISVPNSFGKLEIIDIEQGPRAYVRVRPASWASGHAPDALTVGKTPPDVNAQSSGSSSGSFGTCELGFARFWYSHAVDDTHRSTRSIALYLEDEGEYWFADATMFYERKDGMLFSLPHLLRCWYHLPLQALQQLDNLGGSKRRLIEIGVNGMQNVLLAHHGEFYETPQSRKPKVQRSLERDEWTRENLADFVHEAYNTVLSAFSLDPSSRDEFNKRLTEL